MSDRQKILIVDDRVENLVALENTLAVLDVEVIKATGGNEALALSLKHDFAVAILDVMMPEMDGYELANYLRTDEKTYIIPIVFLTASFQDEIHMFKGYEAGGVDYIVKPYTPDVLLGKVRVFLELARHRKELEQIVDQRTTKLRHTTEVLRSIRDVNQLIVREKNRATLIRKACELLVRTRSFDGAWILIVDEDGTLVDEAHTAYYDAVFSAFIERFRDGRRPPCCRMAGERDQVVAVHAKPEVCGDCPLFGFNTESGRLVAPLRNDNRLFGFIAVAFPVEYADEAEEISLFEEIAGDVSFALASLDAEERLRQHRVLLEETQRIGRIGSWEYQIASGQVIWSPMLYEIYGRDLSLGPPTLAEEAQYYSDEDVARLRATATEIIEKRRQFGTTAQVITPDGGRVDIFAIGAPVEDETGALTKIRGTVQDISDRKRTERLIRARADLFEFAATHELNSVLQHALEQVCEAINSPIGFFHFVASDQRSLVLQTWSKRALNEFCRTPSRGLHYSIDKAGVWADCIRERRPVIHNDYANLPERKGMPAGHPHVTRELAVPIFRDEKVVGIICIGNKPTDYTDQDVVDVSYLGDIAWEIAVQKQAEEALRRSEERFEIAAKIANDVVFERDFATGNAEFFGDVDSIQGYGPGEYPRSLAGYFEHLHPDDVARVSETLQQHGLSPDVLVFEYRLRRKDGEYVSWIERGKLVFNNDGTPAKWIGAATNVTEGKRADQERQKLEDQLRQAQKMEPIGRLAGGVAHDFNNLLTAIRGFSDLVYDSLDVNDPIRNDIGEIQKAADSAAQLTQQLLAFSRKQIVTPKVVNLNKAVMISEKMLQRIIGEDVELLFVGGEDIGRVMIDPAQIDQVLVNLAVNSRDAMPEGGKLTIETRNVALEGKKCQTCGASTDGDYVMLAVSDTGVGMSAETLGQVFEPFFTTKEQGKGTGLGLSTVHGIVHQNGGHINVYSEIGAGTTFKIYLPIVLPDEDVIPVENQPSEVAGKETVLLVEDQNIVRRLAVRTLRNLGYHVIEAQNGGEALMRCENVGGKIDLLLTDVVMPQMNGRQLHERLLRIVPGLKVLYMSGYAEYAIAHHGVIEAGMNFIQKPFRPQDLAIKVRAVLDTNRDS